MCSASLWLEGGANRTWGRKEGNVAGEASAHSHGLAWAAVETAIFEPREDPGEMGLEKLWVVGDAWASGESDRSHIFV